MQVKFKVKPKNGVEEIVQAELVDVIAWEEKFERPSSQLGGNDIFARDFVWLAWHAQKRQGKTPLDVVAHAQRGSEASEIAEIITIRERK